MKKESKSTKDTGHSFADYFKRALNPLLVLLLLSEQPMYVYEMMREISKRSDGRYTISLLYPVIQRLLSQGYVCEGQKAISDDNRVRQYYEITSDGISYLRQIEAVYAEMSKAIANSSKHRRWQRMMEDKIVRQYVRAVSRKLICSKATRSKLLNGLKQELSAYSELSYNELCAKVGNPEQIAEQLLESVDETEIAVSKRKHRFVITLVIGILIVLLLLLAAYYIHAQQVIRGDFYFTRSNTESDGQLISDEMLEN